jgi:biopolymer transport protein ExbD
MMRRSVLDHQGGGVRVNVTPMIDVVMCLIVFYLMVGQLAISRSAGVEIPETTDGTTAMASQGDPIVLAVRADGTLLIDGEPTDPDRLRGELAGRMARHPDARVEVRADRDASYGMVRPALDAARNAGVAEVDLITERAG